MKRKVFVEVDVLNDKFCGMCSFLDWNFCLLFKKKLEMKDALYPIRCEECVKNEKEESKKKKKEKE